MLVRLILNNVFSFGIEKEFNMLPLSRLRRLKEHAYRCNDLDVLKLASIYGANGAGKSNLIKGLTILKKFIVEEKTIDSNSIRFKFNEENQSQKFIIEFFHQKKFFIYGVEIFNNIVLNEELYLSDPMKKNDKLVFERSTNFETKEISIHSNYLEKNQEGKVLKKVIEKNLAKPNKSIFKLLTTLDNKNLEIVGTALDWFNKQLVILTPSSKAGGLAERIDRKSELKSYIENLMKSFHIGIESLETEKKSIKEYFGEDNLEDLKKLTDKFESNDTKMISLGNSKSEILLVKEDNDIFVKELKVSHLGKNNKKVIFDLDEESDGTIRLLDFAPAFQDIVNKQKVYIIDEIERSIHPLLIKQLIEKFSYDIETKGQLIFTTHESNLLDQEIFRQDEIWFSEKDKNGSTDLYSLSDFKEHNTIDIRKGYLSGRYGSIPFLGNLKDLNWHLDEIN
ncbi:ATP-binding protein [Aliarcobacter butzleri]|uniref:AAA family ATPase n=1 Tax=Aliarcobacter butzleri TaxID=28197 RepID=UPI001EDE8606|nr:ATP-binding protein [Aliarcobacter butzleri]MCG3670622.1 ATP-binding protein [Aliarcobacter butzleri]